MISSSQSAMFVNIMTLMKIPGDTTPVVLELKVSIY